MFLSDLKNQKPANGENFIWVYKDSSGNILSTDANHYFVGFFHKDDTTNTARFRVGSQDFFNFLWRTSENFNAYTPTLIPPSTTVKYQGYNSSMYCWGVLYKK